MKVHFHWSLAQLLSRMRGVHRPMKTSLQPMKFIGWYVIAPHTTTNENTIKWLLIRIGFGMDRFETELLLAHFWCLCNGVIDIVFFI